MLSFFPLDVLDEIWYLIESVSEGFPTYSKIFINYNNRNNRFDISTLPELLGNDNKKKNLVKLS